MSAKVILIILLLTSFIYLLSCEPIMSSIYSKNSLENVIFLKDPEKRLIFEFSHKPTFEISKDNNNLILILNNTIIKSSNWLASLPKDMFREVDISLKDQDVRLKFSLTRDFQITSEVFENKLIVNFILDKGKRITHARVINNKIETYSVASDIQNPPNWVTQDRININLPLAGNYTGSPISVDFQDADLRAVMRLFAEVGKMNIVFTDPVNGTITMRVSNVPWDLLFDAILNSFGLIKINFNNLVVIRSVGKVKTETDALRDYMKSLKEYEEAGPLVMKIFNLRYAKAKEVANKISLIIGNLAEVKATQRETIVIRAEEKGARQEVTRIELTIGRHGEKGSITFDESTQLVIVKTTPKIMREIEKAIKALDRPAPQILIEARIVEVSDTYVHSFGIRWGGGAYRITEKTLLGIGNIPQVSKSLTTTQNDTDQMTTSTHTVGLPTGPLVDLGFDPSKPTSRIGFSIGYLGKSLTFIDLELHALEEKGYARIFARPRIVTTNNHPAEFKQGYKIPYLEVTGDRIAGTKFIEAVMGLRVTPHITPDNRIFMDVEVERTLPDWTRAVQGVPPLYTTLVSTRVLVSSGETFVIGGIKLDDVRDSSEGIPWISNVPGVGNLFKRTGKSTAKSEFMVFITPRIITAEVEGVDF